MAPGPVEQNDELIRRSEVLQRIKEHADYRNSYAEYTAGIRRDEAMLMFAEVSRIEPVGKLESEGDWSDHGVYTGKAQSRIYWCHSCREEWVSDKKPNFCPCCGKKLKKSEV